MAFCFATRFRVKVRTCSSRDVRTSLIPES
jgi:hypothetical protein